MKSIPLHLMTNIDTLAYPKNEGCITEKTPALSVLTDFTQHRALVIRGDINAVELENLMKLAHVKMKLVLDNNDKFIGLVTLYDLSEENILRKVNKSTPRSELTVKDFMQSKDTLRCIDLHDLEGATVGDVLSTQKENQLQHCLVIDRKLHKIRGVISARDIARLITPNVNTETNLSFEHLYHKTKPSLTN